MTQFVRWVPKQHAEKALELGILSHNKSATWVFDLSQPYRPGQRISKNSILLAYDLDDTATANIKTRAHIDFESEAFEGESKHSAMIIVKKNEPGAYGIGTLRQGIIRHHVKRTRFATKKEVAKALKLKEKEVSKAYEPPGGWP